MSRRSIVRGTLLALALAAPPAAAATLEEVLSKHVAAEGGREAWSKVRSIKMTGTVTAFSEVKPFTLFRKRDGRFFMDYQLGDKPVLVGTDGQTFWWDNGWFQTGPQRIEGADLVVVRRDAEFEPSLLEAERDGERLKLLGPADFEGQPAIAVELTRADDSIEKWYLDPQTYLAVGRDAPGSDFGRAVPERAFFSDYREHQGVMIPHLVEAQWYTRQRVMQVQTVEVNLEIEDAMFRMPAPTGMGPYQSLAGTWQVDAAQRQEPDAPWQESQRTSTIESLLGGALLEERFATAEGGSVVRTLSYDRYKQRYRLTQINDRTTHLDVQEGEVKDGRLVLSNVETGTTWEAFGHKIHGRLSLFDVAPDGFQLEYEVSTDGGANWFVAAKATYHRTPA